MLSSLIDLIFVTKKLLNSLASSVMDVAVGYSIFSLGLETRVDKGEKFLLVTTAFFNFVSIELSSCNV